MKTTQTEKHFLNLAGEYGVCSELAKRNITASITYGNHKSADVLIINAETKKVLVLEVKTTRSKKIVTGFFQKFKTENTIHPNFWIFVLIDKNNISRYFILSHLELAEVQKKRNGMTKWSYINGVDNVLLENFENFENCWDKILKSYSVL
jgi:hypothetical protein